MSISVDIDLDDVYYQMDRYDKEKMVQWLAEDGYMKSVTEISWPDPQSATEVELIQSLQDIWDNRNCITNNDFNTLNFLSKKGLYE